MANSRKKAKKTSRKTKITKTRATTGKKDARGLVISYCRLGKCGALGKPIFGGPKGFATHKRRHHPGHK